MSFDPSPLPLPRPQRAMWLTALLLTVVIFGSLLFENRHYLFATALYENTDHASDSLMVRESKHTFLLHGHYSQWRFYHPGPALLDTLAAGETLFYDSLRLVPTPYNGQLILLCLVMTIFFSLALSIFARQLGRGGGGYLFFLPSALLFSVAHYGAVGGQVFLDAWPAYPPVLTFLCLMVAAAAVASGGGWALPVLAVAGGWLVHNHVAQPLFVVPLTLLAYATLCWRGWRNARPPWRQFPYAHAIAAAILALFVLPLLLDALHGRNSNLAHILEFMRTRTDPGKKFVRSLCYFLTFGSYHPYQSGTRVFGRYSATGMLFFIGRHWRSYAFWTVALLGAPALFLAAARTRKKQYPPAADPLECASFLRWFYMILAVTWVLTLIWGTTQSGPMYYYNAFFNYSIYFALALGLAAAIAVALMAWTDSTPARKLRPALSALLWLAAAVTIVLQAPRFRVTAFGTPADAAMARLVERTAAALPKSALVFLDCRPWEGWPYAAAVVLELERLGYKARVNDNWEIIFGNERTIQHEKIAAATPLARWMVVPRTGHLAPPGQQSLLPDCKLDLKTLPTVDPAGQRIAFSRGGNFDDFAFFGWSPTDGDWTWSDQHTALLAFRPLPLPAGATGVDLLISAWTSPPPGKDDLQRMTIRFGDAVLATVHLPLNGPDIQPLRVRISSALWQGAVTRGEARLQFFFPDAASPESLGLGTDRRLLGGGFRCIEFQPAPPLDAASTP